MEFKKSLQYKNSVLVKPLAAWTWVSLVASLVIFVWSSAALAAKEMNKCTAALGGDSAKKMSDQTSYPPTIQASQGYYAVLGVARDASEDDIKQAKRRLNRRYHPDFNSSPTAHTDMLALNEAYDCLSDPKKRAEYDAFVSAVRSSSGRTDNHAFSDWVRDQGASMQAATAQAGARTSSFAAAAEAGIFGTWGPLGTQAFKAYLAAGNAATGMRAAAMPGFLNVLDQARVGLAIQKTVTDAAFQSAKSYMDRHDQQQQQKALNHQYAAVIEFEKASDWTTATKIAARAQFYNQIQGSHLEMLEEITAKFGVENETVIYLFVDAILDEAAKDRSSTEKWAYANNLIKPYLRELAKTRHGFEALLLFSVEYADRDFGPHGENQKTEIRTLIGSLVVQTARANPSWLPEQVPANMTTQQKLAYEAGTRFLKDSAKAIVSQKENLSATNVGTSARDVPHLQPKNIFLERPAATPVDPKAPVRKTIFGFSARENSAPPSVSDSILTHVRPLAGNANPGEAMVAAVTLSGQVHFVYPDADRVAYQLPKDTQVQEVHVFSDGRIGMTAIQKSSDGRSKPQFYIAAPGYRPVQFDLMPSSARYSATPHSTLLPGNRVLTGWNSGEFPAFIAGSDGSVPIALRWPGEMVGQTALTSDPVFMPSLGVVAMPLKNGVGIVDAGNSGTGYLIPRVSSEKPLELNQTVVIANTFRDYTSPYKNSIGIYAADGRLLHEIQTAANENLYSVTSIDAKTAGRQLVGLVGEDEGLKPAKIQIWDDQGREQRSLEIPMKLSRAPKGYKLSRRQSPHMSLLSNGKLLVTVTASYAKQSGGEGPTSKDYLFTLLVDPNKMQSSKDVHFNSFELSSPFDSVEVFPMDDSRFMLEYSTGRSQMNYVILDADTLEKIYTIDGTDSIRSIHFAGYDELGAPRYVLQYSDHLAYVVVP